MTRLLHMTLIGALLASAPGCSHSVYVPKRVARGELSLRVKAGGLEIWAGPPGSDKQPVATSAQGWRGLSRYVGCVPRAALLATKAEDRSQTKLALGLILGVDAVSMALGIGLSFVGGKFDPVPAIAMTGVGSFVPLAGLSLIADSKLQRNGAAVDAMNFYNDKIGSLGKTCADKDTADSSAAPDPAGYIPQSSPE